eukprot:2469877-Amphidinium_carterae.2
MSVVTPLPGRSTLQLRGRSRATAPLDNRSAILSAASTLLQRPWLSSLPLLDEGASTEPVTGGFTEVCVVALRWNWRPEGSIAQCIVAVPATATMGLLKAVETHTVAFQTPETDGGAATEEALVAILYFGPEFLRDRLVESTPAANVELHTFGAAGPGSLPITAE